MGALSHLQGLTVATPDPIYVLGNYNANGVSLNNGTNVVNALPAGFMGDSITILSSSWKDSYTSSTALTREPPPTPPSMPPPSKALFNPSPSMAQNTTAAGWKISSACWRIGLRCTTLTYNGSIIVLFQSRYATNYWQTPGNYYNVPSRAWGFDVNFQTQGGLPPIFPSAKAMIRQNWAAY